MYFDIFVKNMLNAAIDFNKNNLNCLKQVSRSSIYLTDMLTYFVNSKALVSAIIAINNIF